MFTQVKHFIGGLMTALLCFTAGVLLHTCTAEPVEAAAPSLEKAAELAAQAEVMKVEAQYDIMSIDSKMEGIVYE